MELEKKSTTLVTFLIFLSWFLINILLNIYNRWLLAHTPYKFPVTMTMFHMLFGFIGSALVLKSGIVKKQGLSSKAFFLTSTLALLTALNYATNNMSLGLINVSMNQVIRATLPISTVLLSLLIEKKRYSIGTVISIIGLGLSASVALFNQPEFDGKGVILASISVVACALWTILSYILQNKENKEERLDSINLLYYSSLQVLVFLAPGAILSEAKGDFGVIDAFTQTPFLFLFYMSVGGLLAFSYNFVHLKMIKHSGSVGSSILANIKIISLVIISIIIFQTKLNTINIVGIAMVFFFSFLYSYLQKKEDFDSWIKQKLMGDKDEILSPQFKTASSSITHLKNKKAAS